MCAAVIVIVTTPTAPTISHPKEKETICGMCVSFRLLMEIEIARLIMNAPQKICRTRKTKHKNETQSAIELNRHKSYGPRETFVMACCAAGPASRRQRHLIEKLDDGNRNKRIKASQITNDDRHQRRGPVVCGWMGIFSHC